MSIISFLDVVMVKVCMPKSKQKIQKFNATSVSIISLLFPPTREKATFLFENENFWSQKAISTK